VQNSIDDGRKNRRRDRKSLLAYLLANLLIWLALDES
jgi:predicted nucleic acid-binding Zn ribbon protein